MSSRKPPSPCAILLVCACAAPLLTASPAPASAQDAVLLQKGRAIIKEKCSPCHATGKSDKSPFADAPPFRSLSRKYPVEQLAEALAEGIVTGHAAMPEFVFEPAEIEAIIAYLASLEDKP